MSAHASHSAAVHVSIVIDRSLPSGKSSVSYNRARKFGSRAPIATPLGVAVVCEATHLCMAMRGVEKQNSYTITSAMLGAFREQSRTRMEFLELLKLRGGIASSGPTHSHDFDD